MRADLPLVTDFGGYIRAGAIFDRGLYSGFYSILFRILFELGLLTDRLNISGKKVSKISIHNRFQISKHTCPKQW